MEKRVSIQPGSPLKQAESFDGQELPPLVLWDGVPSSCAEGKTRSAGGKDLPRSCDLSRRTDHCHLGRVTFFYRTGRSDRSLDCEESETTEGGSPSAPTTAPARYLFHSAQIVDYVDSHVLLRPIEQPDLPIVETPSQETPLKHAEQSLLTLPQWLRLVKRQSLFKSPLPREWQSLPMDSLVELATELGLQVALLVFKCTRRW